MKKENERLRVREVARQLGLTLGLNLLTTGISFLIRHWGFTEVNIVVMYILSVLVTSRFTKGYGYGIFASGLSILSFNFFFTEPLYNFKVDDTSYIFTFIIMFISAMFTSALTSKLLKSHALSMEREKQSHLLAKITGSLAKTSEISETAVVSAEWLSNFMDCDVTCFFMEEDGNMAQIRVSSKGQVSKVIPQVPLEHRDFFIAQSYTIPVEVKGHVLCHFCFPKEAADMDKDRKFLLYSILMQVTISMERVLLIRDKENARAEVELERFKSNLLRAISHDIRTPLTRIMGTSEMLLQGIDDPQWKEVIQGIHEDADWLTRLVENILSFTRVHEGNLAIKIQLEAVDEVLSAVVDYMGKYFPKHQFRILIPDEVLFIPMNGKLMEQVLINLAGNAAEHSPEQSEIVLHVWPEGDKIWFEMDDQGSGFVPQDLPRIFDLFFTSQESRPTTRHGLGLGLAICKAIVEFHGGEIMAGNRAEGGAMVKFYLKNRRDEDEHGNLSRGR